MPVEPQLWSRTVAIDDPGPLVDRLPLEEGFSWLRGGQGVVAGGELVRHKPTDIADASRWWAAQVAGSVNATVDQADGIDVARLPGAGLIAFGTFVFDPEHTAARSAMVVPRWVLGRRGSRCWLTTIGLGSAPAPDLPPLTAPAATPVGVGYRDDSLDGEAWADAVAAVVARIGAGHGVEGGIQKVVLARSVQAQAAAPIDLRWLVARLAERYRRCWTYLVDGMVGASPELLVRREQGLATSRVLAGTIRRTGQQQDQTAHDLSLAAALAESGKDLEEHEYAVASVAAALAPYCSGMNVPDAPYVLQLPNVLHLATDVTAVAHPDADVLTLAAALHPSAAVCGTPTALARATIAELERLDRERYAGPVGWVDAQGDGEWAIALRGGQLDPIDPRRMRLFAGCGVVAGSDPVAELAESVAKLVPMLDALSG